MTRDLSEICRQHLPTNDVCLTREVEKLCHICPSADIEQDEAKLRGLEAQKDKSKKPFGKYCFCIVDIYFTSSCANLLLKQSSAGRGISGAHIINYFCKC